MFFFCPPRPPQKNYIYIYFTCSSHIKLCRSALPKPSFARGRFLAARICAQTLPTPQVKINPKWGDMGGMGAPGTQWDPWKDDSVRWMSPSHFQNMGREKCGSSLGGLCPKHSPKCLGMPLTPAGVLVILGVFPRRRDTQWDVPTRMGMVPFLSPKSRPEAKQR